MNVEPLRGERCTLRQWKPDDAPWYVDARDDAVFEFTTERRDLTEAEVRAAIEEAVRNPSAVPLAIEDVDGKLVGNLAADIVGDTAEISYFLSPAGRGRGVAGDAVSTLVRWLAHQRVRRAVAVVAIANERSALLLERVGFVPTGRAEHERLGPCTEWELRL